MVEKVLNSVRRGVVLLAWSFALLLASPLAAAGAEDEVQVKMSATKPLKANESIADDYFANRFDKPFLVQRLTERTYFIAIDTYDATAYVGDKGVLLIDPLSDGRAAQLLDAVASITDLPITAMIYSHSHMDHINDAQTIADAASKDGIPLRVIATDLAIHDIKRYSKKVPAVTEVVATPRGTVQFEGLTIDVITPRDHGHSEDSSLYHLAEEGVVHYTDIVDPGNLPYLYFNFGKDLKAVEDGLRQLHELDWVFMNGGHGEVGKKHDVALQLDYIADLRAAALKAYQTFDVRDYAAPDKHYIATITDSVRTLTKAVRADLAPKYGQYGDFEHVLEDHVYRMVSDVMLHGLNHLPPPPRPSKTPQS